MLRLFSFLLNQGVFTTKGYCPPLQDGVIGLPKLTDQPCEGDIECGACVALCPTDAIKLNRGDELTDVEIDLGSCIACAGCVRTCPSGTIANDNRTNVAVSKKESLVIHSERAEMETKSDGGSSIFQKSIAARVVSTGCSACDLEIGAAGNAIFDMERFGVHIVASPRFADVLLVTGPAPKAMHEALKSCYDAMAEPRLVIAVGTCAISGGVHKDNYAEANGVDKILPVDVYIPGCPPHPWSIIDGITRARNLPRKVSDRLTSGPRTG